MSKEKKAVKEQQNRRQLESISEGVECDFSNVSMRWGRDWANMDAEFELQEIIRDQDADATIEEKRAAINAIQELEMKRIGMVADVLTSVSADWLVAGAPEDIDFSDVNNILDYIRQSKASDLLLAVHILRLGDSKN